MDNNDEQRRQSMTTAGSGYGTNRISAEGDVGMFKAPDHGGLAQMTWKAQVRIKEKRERIIMNELGGMQHPPVTNGTLRPQGNNRILGARQGKERTTSTKI